MKPNIIAIGLAKQLFNPESREFARMLINVQETNEHHIVVATYRCEKYTDVHQGNLHVYATNSGSRPMMLWDAFWITKSIIKECKKWSHPCIITAQDPLEFGWLSWVLSKSTGMYLHIQVHGDYFSSSHWVGNSVFRYVRRMCALMLLRHAPAIRVVSERIKTSLIARGVRAENITVLPIRPELEVFLQTPHVFKEQLPLTFLSLGRLAPEKDISRIIEAFEIVHAKYPETKLRIVGDGSERGMIEACIKKQKSAGVITLVPWSNNVAKEMSEADVFLLASKHEAYALTLIEAMAAGLPIVTTDVGCVGEVVKDRVHGIVITEESTDAYAKGMEEMYVNTALRKSCGEQGKLTAEKLSEVTMSDYAHSWAKSIGMNVQGGV